jgi:hypothetical protein
VLTIHAELEGLAYLAMADQLLRVLQAERVEVVPLETLAEAVRTASRGRIPVADIVFRPISGRPGTVAMPGPARTP